MQLAQGWQLESLEFDYPVSFALHVDNIVLGGNPGGIRVRVAAQDLDIEIDQLSIDASFVDVDIAFANAAGKTDFFALDDLKVPVIFRPGKLPRVSVDSLRVNLQSGGMAGRTLHFKQLQLARNGSGESTLKTSLPLLDVSDLTGEMEIRILHDSLEAKLQLVQPDHSEILQIEFRQSGTAQNISTEMSGQAHLQALQPLLKAVFPISGSTLDKLKSMRGHVSFEGHFTGRDEQILDHVRITTGKVMIDMENESLGLDLAVEANRQQDWIEINFLTPGAFHYAAKNEVISGLLSELLSVTQQNLSSTDRANETLKLSIEPNSNIKLQINASVAGEFSGAASLELSSSLLDLSLDLAQDAQFRMAELSNPKSLSGSATVNIEVESRQPLTFKAMASTALPMGASLRTSGRLELDEHIFRFKESTGFRAFIPRLTANFDTENTTTGNAATPNTTTGLDVHDLEFSGAAELSITVMSNANSIEFRYSGGAQSKSTRISLSGPEQSPPTLIDAEITTLQLDFSLSGEQMRTSGSGTVHNVRMDSFAVAASQVDLQWNKVDPPAVTGEFRTLTQGLAFSREDEMYQGIDLDVGYALLSDKRVEGQGDLLLAGEVRTPIRFSGGLDSGDWLIEILPAQLSLRQAVQALETTVGKMPGELKLGGGTIDIEGSLNLGNVIQGNMNISGKALGFSLAESTIEGVDFNISGRLDETLAGAGWLSIDRIGLAAGLDLLRTRVSLSSMTPDTIELDDLRAEFFGGQLSADHIWLSPEGLTDTLIKMTDIDLGQVLEFVDVGGLSGTGKLEISLPAGSQGYSLYIRNGVFQANGPGILSYSGSISQSPVENIGLSALDNFHYVELDGTIDYHPDGSYQLKVHLEGSNPNVYNGYPIALNLNIGGILPEAFEALFLTGDFEKAILNKIKQEKLD